MTSPPDQPPNVWSPPIGAPRGKYHLVKPLKVGGTAAIYLAIMRGENNFSREVVIKRPLQHLVAEPRSRHMFIDEAHIASRLAHPNICQVLDLVAREDELYIVLEYLRGVDLREILKRCIRLGRLLPPEVAVWMAVEVAAGLGYAHDATGLDGGPLNLVHRDVSPKNIRITFEGSVKLLDFGIARAEQRITQTAAGTIKGTLGYMSPEQILGDDIDRRSDIFAFGIVLFQMLTLRNPFDGPTLKERVRRLTQAPIPSVREFNPALDDDISAIVERCLERDIDERYARLGQVQAHLEEYLGRLQVVSPRQRLIGFIRQLFPSFDGYDDDLQRALAEISRQAGPVDASVRLQFPGEPPTEKIRNAPTGGAGPNRPASRATPSTPSEATLPATPSSDLRPMESRPGSTFPQPSPASSVASPTDGHADEGLEPETETPLSPSSPRSPLSPDSPPSLSPESAAFDKAATRPPRGPPTKDLPADLLAPRVGEHEAPPSAPRSSGRPSWKTYLPLATVAVLIASWVGVVAWTTPEALLEPSTEPRSGAGEIDAGARAVAERREGARKRPADRVVAVKVDRPRARLLFRTGVRLTHQGDREHALLMYQLAFAYSGGSPDASIALNLGLLHNQQGRDAKAKACLQRYLKKRADGPDAARARMLVSSFGPQVRSVPCVARSEIKRALQTEQRIQSQVDGWLEQTRSNRYR